MKKEEEKQNLPTTQGEVETGLSLTEEEAALVKKNIEESKSYLPEFKFTYQGSNQFREQICKIGEMFCDGVNLGNEIDIWVPTLAYQSMCMDGHAKKFYGKVIFPYQEATYQRSEKYLDYRTKFKAQQEKDFTDGNLFLFYLPNQDIFCQAFMAKTLSTTANQIFNLMLNGKNYFRLKSAEIPGKNYLKTSVEAIEKFPKPTVTSERYEKAIIKLMTDTREEESDESQSAGGR